MISRLKFYYLIILSSFFLVLSKGQGNELLFQDVPLNEALKKISIQSNIKLAYDEERTSQTRINCNLKGLPIEKALTTILQNTEFTFRKSGDGYIIYKKKDNPVAVQEENTLLTINKPQLNTCKVSGVVKDRNSGEQLPFAAVFQPGTSNGTICNASGYFNLIINTCDSALLEVTYVGYQAEKIKALAREFPELITILVGNQIEILDEVQVTNNPEIVETPTLIDPLRIKMNPTKLAQAPSLLELDVMAPIQLLPGIDGSTETSSGFLIRKSGADKNLILYDGFNIYQIDHFLGSFSSINGKAIKDIQVYKTGYGAKYGGRTGGVIEITGKTGNMYKPVIDFGADLLSLDAKIEAPLIKEKLAFIISTRRSYTNIIQSPLYINLFESIKYDFDEYYTRYPKSFQTDPYGPKYNYSDLQGKVTFIPFENQVFSLSYHYSNDRINFLDLSQYPTIEETAKWGTRGISLRWNGTITRNWQSTFVIGSSNTQLLFNHEDTVLKKYKTRLRNRIITLTDTISRSEIINNRLNDKSILFENKIQMQTQHIWSFGVSSNQFKTQFYYNFDYQSTLIENSQSGKDYNKNSILISPFIQYTYSNQKFVIQPGYRFNYYNITQQLYHEPRISMSYKPGEKILFKSSYSVLHQMANQVQLKKGEDLKKAWILSDGSNFEIIVSKHLMGGINFQFWDQTSVDLEIYKQNNEGNTNVYSYYRKVKDKIKLETSFLIGNSNVVGMDLLFKKQYKNNLIWLAYTLSKSEWNYPGINNGQTIEATDDQLHEIKLFLTRKIKKWEFSASNILGSGKTWHSYSDGTTFESIGQSRRYSFKLPYYQRLDGSISFTHRLRSSEIKYSISGFNLLNRKNLIDKTQQLSDDYIDRFKANQNIFDINEIYGIGFLWNFYIGVKF